MSYRKIPSYITKGRAGYALQRGVPPDIRQVIGKTIFKASGGKTLSEARARVESFLERTDREIAIARGELLLSPAEQIERLTYEPDPELRELYVEGARIDEAVTDVERARLISIVTGEVQPKPFYSASDLIAVATKLKSPADRTEQAWRKELGFFLDFCGKASPLSCTKEDATAWRAELLNRVSANTTKTRLAYLAGLWSILVEEHGDAEHIFSGLTKRIKVEQREKLFTIKPVKVWSECLYLDLFKILYYTGARLAEVAGLRGEDILADRINIQPHEDRPLKTKASSRYIPIHPCLESHLGPYRSVSGLIWPRLKTEAGGGALRWGHNLSKPCRAVTGATPHELRHWTATRLREANFNEATIGRLLGHTPNTVTAGYGMVPWNRLVEAVCSLN